jgi:D-glycero-alpha-D-manno-heptose-7-phosphate kinase
VGPAQLAEEACDVEINRCKKPIGKQDQYIAAFGGLGAFSFKKDGAVAAERIPLSDADLRALASNLFLFYSSSTRQASTILAEQARKTHQNLERLDKIAGLAAEVREALRNRQFDRLGSVLDRNWRLKRELASQISNSRLDQMHAAAMQAGATGAKVCGAGGGGFLLVYCPAQAQERLLAAMADHRRMPFSLERDGSKVIFNYRRPSWK